MKNKTSKTDYSWKTSLPAYLENAVGKDMQGKLIYYVLSKLPGKKGSLKEIQDTLRVRFKIRLPQSTISGRVGDLREENKIAFFGDTKVYRDRIRKVFHVLTKWNRDKKRKGKKVVFQKVQPTGFSIGSKTKIVTVKLSDGSTWASPNGHDWAKKKKQIRKRRPLGYSLKKRRK